MENIWTSGTIRVKGAGFPILHYAMCIYIFNFLFKLLHQNFLKEKIYEADFGRFLKVKESGRFQTAIDKKSRPDTRQDSRRQLGRDSNTDTTSKCDGHMDGPTNRPTDTVRCKVACL